MAPPRLGASASASASTRASLQVSTGVLLASVAALMAAAVSVNALENTTDSHSHGEPGLGAGAGAGAGVGLMQAALARGCAAKYTMTCLKLDALSVLSRMAVPASYDILPGVSIRRSASETTDVTASLPPDLVQTLAADPPLEVDKRLDDFLVARFGTFLDSHTVQVRLLDLQPVASIRKALTSTTTTTAEDPTAAGSGGAGPSAVTSPRGRKRNGLWQQLMGAGMMMGGSTLTMGLSALAAMAGKALMLSMLSLVLSAMSGLGSGGGGGGHSQKQTTYEIISKPIYTHGHSHSAELHHDPSGPAAAAYGLYGRSKDAEAATSPGAGVGVGAGVGATGVGGSALGGSPATTYLSQYPRSLQESSQITQHQTKKGDEKASTSSVAVSNYDSLLTRNLQQYVKGENGRAKYSAVANGGLGAVPVDLVPSESDYGSDVGSSKYASPEEASARSFRLTSGEEDGAADAGAYESVSGVLAGPRSMHNFARIPQLLIGEAVDGPRPRAQALVQQQQQAPVFRGSPPDLTGVLAPAAGPRGALTYTADGDRERQGAPGSALPYVHPAFVIAKPVSPSSSSSASSSASASSTSSSQTQSQTQSQTPRSDAYRANS